MKKLFWVGVILSFMVVALGPTASQALNSGAHIYVVDQVFPFALDKIDLYYGSIAPDIPLYASPEGYWPNGFCETHYKYIKLPYTWWNLPQKAFAKGWQTHNEIWGADSFAHGTCGDYVCCIKKECNYLSGYVNQQAGFLASQFPDILNEEAGFALAHFAVEVAIDLLLITENYDPYLGQKLLGAALLRSPADFDLLVKVFVSSGRTDLPTLTAAESTFRDLVIKYGTALTLPEPLRMGVLSQLGVQIAQAMGVVEIDSSQVKEILNAAIDLCKDTDYYGIIDQAVESIRHKPGLIR